MNRPIKRRCGWRAMVIAAALLTGGAWMTASAVACPNCAASLPSDDGKESPKGPAMAEGYAWSIGLMLIVPALMVGGLGFGAYVALKRAAANAATGTPGGASDSAAADPGGDHV